MSALNIKVSQGSVVKHLKHIGVFNDHCVANVLLSVPVKKFWKSVNIWRSYEIKNFGGLLFYGLPDTLTHTVAHTYTSSSYTVDLMDKTHTHYTRYLHSQYYTVNISCSWHGHLIIEHREYWKINIAVLQFSTHHEWVLYELSRKTTTV